MTCQPCSAPHSAPGCASLALRRSVVPTCRVPPPAAHSLAHPTASVGRGPARPSCASLASGLVGCWPQVSGEGSGVEVRKFLPGKPYFFF